MDGYIRDLAAALPALVAVPDGPFELPTIEVAPALEAAFARVLAPKCASAGDVTIEQSTFRWPPGASATLITLRVKPDCEGFVDAILARLAQHTRGSASYSSQEGTESRPMEVSLCIRADCVDVVVDLPRDAPHGAVVTLTSLSVARQSVPLPLPLPSIAAHLHPDDVSHEQFELLRGWLGERGKSAVWLEIFRASRDGFTPDSFHRKCAMARVTFLCSPARQAAGGFLAGTLPLGGSASTEGRSDIPTHWPSCSPLRILRELPKSWPLAWGGDR